MRPHAATLPIAWVAPENFHVTVKFLGSIDEAQVSTVTDALHRALAHHRAFDVEVATLGAFPSPTRPRVLWAGIADGSAALAEIAVSVDDALASLGFAREPRAFAGHVTLGRVREPRRAPALAEAVAAGAGRAFGRVHIGHVALMRSDLSPRGPRYSELATVALQP